jgi:hypothetical protein
MNIEIDIYINIFSTQKNHIIYKQNKQNLKKIKLM